MITLGVQDFRRERDFYQDLGWPLMFDSDVFVAFDKAPSSHSWTRPTRMLIEPA
jgi:catechol 2,3-dioxygenase-like lactoylglutathione lyase family enzyme